MKNKQKYCFIGAGIVLFVICTILLYIFAPAYLDSFFVFAVGCVLCGCAIGLMTVTYSCKEKVSAVLVNYGFEQFKAHITSSPVFTYQYQGKTYTTSSAECLSQRYVLKHYKEGGTYTIYLSPKDPSFLKIRRGICIFDLVLLLAGASPTTKRFFTFRREYAIINPERRWLYGKEKAKANRTI